MKSTDEKSKQKELLKNFKLKERQAFIESLPFDKEKFEDLFDFLNKKLESEGCDHALSLTLEYLQDENLYTEKAIEFLKKNGGYCDCEVLSNIEEKFEEL